MNCETFSVTKSVKEMDGYFFLRRHHKQKCWEARNTLRVLQRQYDSSENVPGSTETKSTI